MKKVLFMQIKGNSLGGVWFVNKLLSEKLIEKGYQVNFLNIRNNTDIKVEYNNLINMITINEKDKWEILHLSDLKLNLKNHNYSKFLKNFIIFIKGHIKLKFDFIKASKIIKEINPDYIINSHYQLLNVLDKRSLSKCINVHHSSYDILKKEIKNYNTLKKYNGKITYAWLCKSSQDKAIEDGFINNNYIYNPIKFKTDKIADVINNKKIITIARLTSPEKRINLMLKIVDRVLKKHKDWTFELYGPGEINEECMEIVNSNKQIKLMGPTNDVEKVLLSSSIYLSTSCFEGFSLSILEGYECGVPSFAFNFGESCMEQIPNSCGIIINDDDIKEFENKLDKLMSDEKKLAELSKHSKEFARKFSADKIVDNWIKLFKEMSGKND